MTLELIPPHARSRTIVSRNQRRVVNSEWLKPEGIFRCLGGEVLEKLLAACTPNQTLSYHRRRTVVWFDTALQLHGDFKFVDAASLDSEDFLAAQRWFYGAMWSGTFVDLAPGAKQILCGALSRVLKAVQMATPVKIAAEYPRKGTAVPKDWIEEYCAAPKNEAAVAELKSYLLVDKNGVDYAVLLHPMRQSLGAEFTNRFHLGLVRIAQGRAKDTALRDFGTHFSQFVSSEEGLALGISPERLQDPEFARQVIVSYRKFHFLRHLEEWSADRVRVLESVNKLWKRTRIYWSKLSALGMFAMPTKFPSGAKVDTNAGPYHVKRASGGDNADALHSNKLITAIPLHCSDEEAVERLVAQVRADFQLAKQWLEENVDVLWFKYRIGKDITIGVDLKVHSVPSRYDTLDAIVYFREQHGSYINTVAHATHVFTAGKLKNTASEKVSKTHVSMFLGLPGREDALTFLAWLMSCSGKFTEKALASMEIFDAHGNASNLVLMGKQVVLSVKKDRAGQIEDHTVILHESDAVRVQRWLTLTQPIRNRMREEGIPGWTKLFVYLASPLGRPGTFDRTYNINSAFRDLCLKHEEWLGNLAGKLTPSRIRASRGLLRYLDNFSVQEMAEELGNEPRTTLEHYLPEAIWNFLYERYVRIFQVLRIHRAAKDSPFMLRAAGIDSMEHLDSLLRQYSLKFPQDEAPAEAIATSTRKKGKGIVVVSEEALLVLASLSSAVSEVHYLEEVAPHAIYWHEFYTRLSKYIDSEQFYNGEIKGWLESARKLADAGPYRKLVLNAGNSQGA